MEKKKVSFKRKNAAELRFERVTAMEARLNRAVEAVAFLEKALDLYETARNDLSILETYLASPEWKRDFNAREAGKLPPDLPCGVLSEDGIYDLLERNDELRSTMSKLLPAEDTPGSAE